MIIGDIVQLSYGGPYMTVEYVGPDEVKTVWFDDKSKLFRGSFPTETLRVTQPLGTPDSIKD